MQANPACHQPCTRYLSLHSIISSSITQHRRHPNMLVVQHFLPVEVSTGRIWRILEVSTSAVLTHHNHTTTSSIHSTRVEKTCTPITSPQKLKILLIRVSFNSEGKNIHVWKFLFRSATIQQKGALHRKAGSLLEAKLSNN